MTTAWRKHWLDMTPQVQSRHPEFKALLKSALWTPEDLTPRRILADWLDERGDERCVHLRWSCAVEESLPDLLHADATLYILPDEVDCPDCLLPLAAYLFVRHYDLVSQYQPVPGNRYPWNRLAHMCQQSCVGDVLWCCGVLSSDWRRSLWGALSYFTRRNQVRPSNIDYLNRHLYALGLGDVYRDVDLYTYSRLRWAAILGAVSQAPASMALERVLMVPRVAGGGLG